MSSPDPKKIETYPTKDFFISMLIRDVSLKDAIGDLVDNCVDGARSISPDYYSGFSIEINFDEQGFTIKDNCGGIDIKLEKTFQLHQLQKSLILNLMLMLISGKTIQNGTSN